MLDRSSLMSQICVHEQAGHREALADSLLTR